ncbi:MAG: hypothetical protein PHE88_11735 [Elusimicrobia bacterium]|nr:hypothetical protein [Elusimicrobiota bacterium]
MKTIAELISQLSLDYVFLTVKWMFITLVYFLAIMKVREIRDAGGFTWANKPFFYVILFIGLIRDAGLNIIMSVIFLQVPRYPDEYLLTARLKNLIRNDTGWRGDIAYFLCNHFLNPADKNHCG